MPQNEWWDLISVYLDDRLEPEKKAAFEEKMRTDSSLRAEVAAQRRIKNYLHRLPRVEVLNDNFKSYLLRRVDKELIPLKRNYRLNYATVTLTVILVSFLLGGGAYGITSLIAWMNATERYIANVDTSVPTQVRPATDGSGSVAPPMSPNPGITVNEAIVFDVRGTKPEDFFSTMLSAYSRGEVVREVVAPFFEQTSIFDGATVGPPSSKTPTAQPNWLRFGKSLPTEINIVINGADYEKFRDYMVRQKGVVPPKPVLSPHESVDATGSDIIRVRIRFKEANGS